MSNDEAPGADDDLMGKLRAFVRAKAPGLLNDPNVSSLGVGYKITDGRPTGEIALQFTVDRKVQREAFEALATTAIPESILVAGVVIPTDVLERSYSPGFRTVAEAESPTRRTRIDPIRPGVSVGNSRSSAGTIGCIVYDCHTGEPYVLSNWHILHGPRGVIGGRVVQPGPYDDNRVDANGLGKLVRSYLGVAGDCALASIESRRFDGSVLELDVTPDQLGEPELGDRVVKSGRTTGITHGIVRRIDTLTRMYYGGNVGEQRIGGFEIGPDPAAPASDSQVSKGGDSGSAWLFNTAAGKPGTVLAGLHFAGESGGSDGEHALACLPASVFEKLEIALVRRV